MAEAEEFRCFVGGLSWSTTDKGLEDAFRSFGNVLEAKVRFCLFFPLHFQLCAPYCSSDGSALCNLVE